MDKEWRFKKLLFINNYKKKKISQSMQNFV